MNYYLKEWVFLSNWCLSRDAGSCKRVLSKVIYILIYEGAVSIGDHSPRYKSMTCKDVVGTIVLRQKNCILLLYCDWVDLCGLGAWFGISENHFQPITMHADSPTYCALLNQSAVLLRLWGLSRLQWSDLGWAGSLLARWWEKRGRVLCAYKQAYEETKLRQSWLWISSGDGELFLEEQL